MNSQRTATDALSLRYEASELEINNKFQLNRKRLWNLGLIVITTFETKRSLTLFCDSLTESGLNLLDALRSGLLELVESGKDDVILLSPAPSPPQLGHLIIPPKPSPQHRQVSIGVFTDTTHAAWKEILRPGCTYGLRLSKTNGEVFTCYTDGYNGWPESELRIGREGGTCYFIVHDDPAPPKIFARLSMPVVAHLTGPEAFTFVIEYTTDSPEPLVINKSRSPLSVFPEDLKSLDQLIDCRNILTDEKVSWSGVFGCWDSDPHPSFPDDEDFVEIVAGKSWRFECTLENLDNEEEYVRSMQGLEAGRSYRVKYAGPTAFVRWQWGRKEELLKGSDEDKKRRWDIDGDVLGILTVEDVGDNVEFEAVV
jgi:hypothetical protein